MKKGIHPESGLTTFTCNCGNTMKMYSTLGEKNYSLEVCSECHPFYTGKQGTNKKNSNVEKFNKKFNLNK